VGALLLAVREGTGYRYVGKVGTGFSQASLLDLSKRLKPLRVGEPTAEGAPRMRDAEWAKPELVCQVRFTEWTKGGALRHTSFEGLREDKKASAVIREEETPVAAVNEARWLLTRLGR
jgi:bifunctional non-homologous end joining protein LigD